MSNLTLVCPVLAYFDPGSASLVMQAIVGGSAGLFVFAKYLWNSVPALRPGRKAAADSKRQDSVAG
ncbi:MAG: hypothetical protein JWM11_4888 [Planctomycetaceae bacterium]|nr:hypothetical protein [Planctomycetaceae bacterium]